MTQTTTALSTLSIDPMNVRKSDREADPAFVANVRAKGIIEPLVVRQSKNNGYLVTNGGKRLSALNALLKEGHIKKDHPVPIIVREDGDREALDTSLSANLHAAMHPVDMFEAVNTMIEGGDTIDGIAKRYGLERKQVQQAMALAKLAPELREAWRDGKIKEEQAAAFTIEQDHKRQVATYDRLKKQGHWSLQPGNIRRELKGDSGELSRLLKFVGRDAYKKAGGVFTEDLFTDREADMEIVASGGILRKLATDKIEAEIERLKKEDGWAWAAFDDHGNRWKFDRQEKKKYSADDKKKMGCFLVFDGNGKLHVEAGYIKGRAKIAAEKASETKAAKAKPTKQTDNPKSISGALGQRLTEQRDKALKTALRLDKPASDLCRALQAVVADQIRPGTGYHAMPAEIKSNLDAIMAGITPKVINEQLRIAFKADDYFGGINTAQLAACLAEMGDKTSKGKKIALVKIAAKLSREKGWLPLQLRHANYDGPGAKGKKR